MPTQVKIKANRPRGSALVMAIVITMLLFIIGIVFVITTQKERTIVTGSEFRQSLDAGVDAVVEQIHTVLINDLFGTDGNMLNGDAGSDEYWDYPGPDDPWLASLEPESYNDNGTSGNTADDWVVWRHITDLYGNNFEPSPVGAPFYSPEDHTNPDQWDSTKAASRQNMVSWTPDHFIGRIISDNLTTETIYDGDNWDNPTTLDYVWKWGGQADADGDGIADSCWVRIPGVTGSQGQNVYAAVRIIDNCGMININTAYCDPRTLSTPEDWDGTQLTQINLDTIPVPNTANASSGILGIRAFDETLDLLNDFQTERSDGTTPATNQDYNRDVAVRVLNPAVPVAGITYYNPFDISDELALRYRFFLNSCSKHRYGYKSPDYLWDVTFEPGTNTVGKIYPYVLGEDIDNWFDNVNCGWEPTTGNANVGYYNRRAITTTYSFDRVMVPRDSDWTAASATSKGDTMPPVLKMFWDSWDNWNTATPLLRPVCISDVINKKTLGSATLSPEILAAAIWLALPSKDTLLTKQQFKATDLNWDATTREQLACQMAVNLIDYVDTDTISTHLRIDDNNLYFGFEAEAGHLYIARVGISYKNGNKHYALQIYNHGVGIKANINAVAGDWVIDVTGTATKKYNLPAFTLAAGDSMVFIDSSTADGFEATDFGSLSPAVELAGFTFDKDEEITLLGPSESTGSFIGQGQIPVDSIDVNGLPPDPDPADTINRKVSGTLDRAGREIAANKLLALENIILLSAWDSFDTTGVSTLNTQMTTPGPITVPYQIESNGTNNLLNMGEIYNTLIVNGMRVGGVYISLNENWYRLFGGGGGDITTGRLDAGDADYANLTRYLAVDGFSPFSDYWDNDGNGRSDDPAQDGEDNNHNGTIDASDPLETYANYGEASELAIAGRININTASFYVIAQLPWMQDTTLANNDVNKLKLAMAITAYRDLIDLSGYGGGAPNYSDRATATGLIPAPPVGPGFTQIGELLNVTQPLSGTYDQWYDFRRFEKDAVGSAVPMDFTADAVENDLEERNILFQRVSNLVTVRSDVFTAYIAIRVGEEGPQKRVIAIFDRSKVFSPADKPRLVALHPVPDPS